ncbi:putative oxidoreductase, aryl-alcohol dehydrogenases like protein [Candidatus Sulfopaludibacter sp. SbA6]|nr:putative oxidoreductase, aryl-alcohol dehydrogenases like protein [Candidatus Sulfopaludibacter sp. SbA6]
MAFEERTLGRTGLRVARLGVAASYGVPAAAIERAFEQGVNYLYWGSLRRAAFAQALRNLASHRDRFVLVVESYSRFPSLLRLSLERALRKLRMEHADILLLGLWNKEISGRILDASRELRDRGLVRFLAVSTHRRPLVPQLAANPDIDVLHFRYNAAHPGAEVDIFPRLPATARPGMVSFTATSWGQLLKPSRIPRAERVPTASDCYRFVLARPEVDVCLTGPANSAQLDEALRALQLGPMNPEELAWMRRAGARHS